MTGYLIGLGVPEKAGERTWYAYIILGLPLVTSILALLLFFFIFTQDTPKSLMLVGDEATVLFAP